MNKRNLLAFCISIVSYCFFFPGITLNMMTISSVGSVEAPVVDHVGLPQTKVTKSIIKTINDLYHRDNRFVACMILLFSIIVPLLKGALLIYISLSKNRKTRIKLFSFIKSIGKWSMADVFVVATFLAYLSAPHASEHNVHESVILGIPIDINIATKMTAQLDVGFYCFVSYCLLALIALQLYKEEPAA